MLRVGFSARSAVTVLLSAGCGVSALAAPSPWHGASATSGESERPALRPARGVLRLRSGSVELATRTSILDAPAASLAAGRFYVVAFDGPMTAERHRALADAGVSYAGYLPDDAALVTVGKGVGLGAIRRLGFVRWAGVYDDAWKMDPELKRPARRFATAERQALEDAGTVAVVAYLFDGQALAPFLGAVRSIPGAVFKGSELVGETRSTFLTLPRGRLAALAAMPSVRFVEEMPEFVERNSDSRWIVQGNQQNLTPLYDHGLTGAGQVLGFIDNKLSTTHCSFNDPAVPIDATNTPGLFPTHRKVLAYNTSYAPNDFHGTHCAGTAVGDAGAWDDTRGVAYAAKLVHNYYPNVNETSVYDRFNLHYSQGACVHSSSWGNNGTAQYDGTCRAIDNLSWQFDDNLLVFAVADLSIIRNPENAKNCLAVGACGGVPGSQNGWCYGGTGPTNDGRRKPEIMAPGCGIASALYSTGCGLISKSGTSMATPAVSATALMARQYFMEGFYPTGSATPANSFIPSGALLKAVLVNSAMDMTTDAGSPTNQEGWGRVQADEALYFAGDARRLMLRDVRNNSAGALATGQPQTHYVLVNGSAQTLKVTLAYHDAPATLPASFAPVNRVYVQVTAPDATVYYGNNVTDGASTPGGTFEILNNLQEVIVPSPAAGVWTVTVVPQAVNVGAQGYGLVMTGDVSELCPSDFDHNGFVNGVDFDSFVEAFVAGDPSADFDHNTFVNGVDFDSFVEAFEAGC